MIISILAAAVLGVAAVAGETAREAKTRVIISRIHTLLMEQYDTYVNRRVKLRSQVFTAINGSGGPPASKGQFKAQARLFAMREMIVMEIPDRWSDVLFAAVPGPDTSIVNIYPILSPLYLDASSSAANNGRTEIANVYLRQFDRITKADNKISGNRNIRKEILDNQGAECLYMIVMNACGDGESRTLFPESSIGDTDGDGALEFIDGWGHPIEFVRWAPGFESDIQINANELEDAADSTAAWTSAGSSDHDPFDLYRMQQTAYRLVPLIYSAGRDEEAGFYRDPEFVTWKNPNAANPSIVSNAFSPALNPYGRGTPTFPTEYFGTIDNSKADTDNLHNHLIGTR